MLKLININIQKIDIVFLVMLFQRNHRGCSVLKGSGPPRNMNIYLLLFLHTDAKIKNN
jgi:hypothetical protein